MKSFLIAVSALLFVGSASATFAQSSSLSSEYTALRNNLTAETDKNRKYLVQTLTQGSLPFLRAYNSTRNFYISELNQLGSNGTLIASRLSAAIDSAVTALIALYNPISIDARIVGFLIFNQTNILTTIDLTVYSRYVVAAVWNSKVWTCWTQYKPLLRDSFIRYFTQTRSIINQELATAQASGQSLNATIYADVQAIEADARSTCGSNSTCYLEFFRARETAIRTKISDYYNQIRAIFNTALNNIASGVSSVANTEFSYLKQVDRNMTSCYRS